MKRAFTEVDNLIDQINKMKIQEPPKKKIKKNQDKIELRKQWFEKIKEQLECYHQDYDNFYYQE